jgi:hypothetical protein
LYSNRRRSALIRLSVQKPPHVCLLTYLLTYLLALAPFVCQKVCWYISSTFINKAETKLFFFNNHLYFDSELLFRKHLVKIVKRNLSKN